MKVLLTWDDNGFRDLYHSQFEEHFPRARYQGRVFADLACAMVDGTRVISDFRVMGDQRELLGRSRPSSVCEEAKCSVWHGNEST